MTVQVKISSKTPDEKLHGLETIREQLVEHDQETVLVVAKVRTLRVNKESEKGGLMVPIVRVLAWEPLTGDAAKDALTLYEQAYTERTGDGTLPREFWAEDEQTGQVRKVEPHTPDVWLDPAAAAVDRDDLPSPGDAWCDCGAVIIHRVSDDVWVDAEGWPAKEGHAHAPAATG